MRVMIALLAVALTGCASMHARVMLDTRELCRALVQVRQTIAEDATDPTALAALEWLATVRHDAGCEARR